MKLDVIEIKNYRSLFHNYDKRSSFTLKLGDGMNTIAGPNNVGKSNIFRALAFALVPDFEFDRAKDMPSIWNWSKPSVTLTFRVPLEKHSHREKTLLRYLDDYEHEVNPDIHQTFASTGTIKLRVTIEGAEKSIGSRREVFVASGAGARTLPDDHELTHKSLAQFRKCFHFVSISSGESLESLMEGKFRDILQNVLRENLAQAYRSAEESRDVYCSDLQSGLLQPLTVRIGDELKDLFPEISAVSLSPDVLSLDETLSKMRVRVSDVAHSRIANQLRDLVLCAPDQLRQHFEPLDTAGRVARAARFRAGDLSDPLRARHARGHPLRGRPCGRHRRAHRGAGQGLILVFISAKVLEHLLRAFQRGAGYGALVAVYGAWVVVLEWPNLRRSAARGVRSGPASESADRAKVA